MRKLRRRLLKNPSGCIVLLSGRTAGAQARFSCAKKGTCKMSARPHAEATFAGGTRKLGTSSPPNLAALLPCFCATCECGPLTSIAMTEGYCSCGVEA